MSSVEVFSSLTLSGKEAFTQKGRSQEENDKKLQIRIDNCTCFSLNKVMLLFGASWSA